MVSIEIKKGELESSPYILAHKVLTTVFCPVMQDNYKVSILGSHDGVQYGSIFTDHGELFFYTQTRFSVTTFTPSDFLGIMYLKFVLDKPVDENLTFPINIDEV